MYHLHQNLPSLIGGSEKDNADWELTSMTYPVLDPELLSVAGEPLCLLDIMFFFCC